MNTEHQKDMQKYINDYAAALGVAIAEKKEWEAKEKALRELAEKWMEAECNQKDEVIANQEGELVIYRKKLADVEAENERLLDRVEFLVRHIHEDTPLQWVADELHAILQPSQSKDNREQEKQP